MEYAYESIFLDDGTPQASESSKMARGISHSRHEAKSMFIGLTSSSGVPCDKSSRASLQGFWPVTWSRRFWGGQLQRRLVRLGPHPVDGPPHRGLLHKASLEPTFAWKVYQHQTNQDGENPLPREQQHGQTDEDNQETE
jgi:hypothetical protein